MIGVVLCRYDNLHLDILLGELAMCHHLFDMRWPTHELDVIARAQVPKGNQSHCSPISSLPTKNIVCYLTLLRVQCCQRISHAGTVRVWVLNKIHQT